jgi:hypothetical protein
LNCRLTNRQLTEESQRSYNQVNLFTHRLYISHNGTNCFPI